MINDYIKEYQPSILIKHRHFTVSFIVISQPHRHFADHRRVCDHRHSIIFMSNCIFTSPLPISPVLKKEQSTKL
jgi:hypothetical protein